MALTWALMAAYMPAATALAGAVPTVGGAGNTVTAIAGGAPVVISPNLTLSNFDTIDGASVTIGNGLSWLDQLSFTSQGGVTGTYDGETGVLRLTGSASPAVYQAVLRSVTYQNPRLESAISPSRSITFAVGAGTLYFQGTGHYYEYVKAPGIHWTDAEVAAESRTLYGLHGYLATIGSVSENQFVAGKLQGQGWMGASDAGQEGVWKWVTGPENGTQFSDQNLSGGYCSAARTGQSVNGHYANWAGGEPNNCGGNENYGHFWANGTWNDYANDNGAIDGYVVEYGGMAGDAAPVLQASATVLVKQDTTAPVINAVVSGPAGGNGWYLGPVTVQVSATDDGTGVDYIAYRVEGETDGSVHSDTVLVPVTGEGSRVVYYLAADKAGNKAQAALRVSIDLTAPKTTISAPAGWQNQDVPVTLTAADGLSGVAATYYTVDGGAQQSGTSLTVAGEGTHTVTFWSVDKAGNAEAPQTATVKIDKTAPTISGAPDRTANAAGWYNAGVTVTFTCGDSASGPAACTAPTTLGNEGAGQSVTGSAKDNAGNTAEATVSGINIDLTAPTVTYSGNAGTYTVDQQVTIVCKAADSLSGLAGNTCENVTGPAYSFSLGQNSFSASATDNADNVGQGSTTFTVSVTTQSLCSLSRQFAPGQLGNSLCAKLTVIGKTQSKGGTETAANQIEAFVSEVEAQSGKALTSERADILIRLARSLTLVSR